MAKLKMPKLKTDKTVGYVLLLVGVLLILLAIYWAASAFKSGSSPVSVFKWADQNISIKMGENQPSENLSIPGASISNTTNLGLWLMLMFFVASGGGRIANLGIKLIREIKVEVKVKE